MLDFIFLLLSKNVGGMNIRDTPFSKMLLERNPATGRKYIERKKALIQLQFLVEDIYYVYKYYSILLDILYQFDAELNLYFGTRIRKKYKWPLGTEIRPGTKVENNVPNKNATVRSLTRDSVLSVRQSKQRIFRRCIL